MRWPWAAWILCGTVWGLSGRAPAQVIPETGVLGGAVYGPLQRSTVAVTGQSFPRAARFRTTSSPANVYDAGFTLRTTAAVAAGDVLSGEAWIRRITPAPGEAFATFNFEKGSAPYDKSLAVTWLSGSTNWTRFRFAFASVAAYAAGEAQVAIHLGFPPQTLDIGGLVITNHRRSRPITDFPNDMTYSGRDPEASWRAPAAARIAEHRQAMLTVTVTDEQGTPLSGVPVEIRQQRHAFGFGTAADAARTLGPSGSAADRSRYQWHLTNWFNRIVLENDLKWPQWERTSPNGARLATNALNWFAARGLPVRGHNLIWPGTGASYFLPADVPPLFSRPDALRTRIGSHFRDVLGRTRGLCSEWDVINEPLHETEIEAVLGRGALADWFRLARSLDPAAALYLNEYNNLETPARTGTEALRALLLDLQTRGAPVDGVGLQGHFGGFLTAPEEVHRRISMLVSPDDGGIPAAPVAQITEFDVNVPDEATQADYTRDFLTTAFSHPKVNAVLVWGFWAGQHWRPGAAMLRQNWEVKPNGITWSNLIFREWWTHTNVVSDARGRVAVRAFRGDHVVRVSVDGTAVEQNVSLAADREATLALPVATPRIDVELRDSGVRLGWPAGVLPFRLEESPRLAPASWRPVESPPMLHEGRWVVDWIPTGSESFLRLVR